MNGLHEKLTIIWWVQKFPTLSGAILVLFWSYIHHWILSWVSWIQPTPLPFISSTYNLILSVYLTAVCPHPFFTTLFKSKLCMQYASLPCMLHMCSTNNFVLHRLTLCFFVMICNNMTNLLMMMMNEMDIINSEFRFKGCHPHCVS